MAVCINSIQVQDRIDFHHEVIHNRKVEKIQASKEASERAKGLEKATNTEAAIQRKAADDGKESKTLGGIRKVDDGLVNN